MRPARTSSPWFRPLVLSLALLGAGACGGGGGDGESEAPPAPPAADVDPNAGGVVGGSINRAKDVADDAESRDAQLEDPGTTSP